MSSKVKNIIRKVGGPLFGHTLLGWTKLNADAVFCGTGHRIQWVTQIINTSTIIQANATPTVGSGLRLKSRQWDIGKTGGRWTAVYTYLVATVVKFDVVNGSGSSFSTDDGFVSVRPRGMATHQETTAFPGVRRRRLQRRRRMRRCRREASSP